jgi:putative ABC transport system substrate-binding protein
MLDLRRREFIALLSSGAAVCPSAARAQRPTKSYRVAYLALLGDLDAVIVKQRLAELGYAEHKNLIFDLRSAEGQPERLPQLAAEYDDGCDGIARIQVTGSLSCTRCRIDAAF